MSQVSKTRLRSRRADGTFSATPLADRIAMQIQVTEAGCSEWMGSRDAPPKDYGRIRGTGMGTRVHRVVWIMHNGPIPAGMVVCHRCDNPPCCNPDHLFLGSVADNNRDRDTKGRHVRLLGSAHGNAKLNESQVREIRERHANGESRRDLAAEYDTDYSNVSLIVRGRAWVHV